MIGVAYLAVFLISAPRFTRQVVLADTNYPDGEDWLFGAVVGILAAALWPLSYLVLAVIHFAKAGAPPC